jgi:hypothetical protein
MPIAVGPGIEIGGGITLEQGFSTSVSLIYDLDAANYSAVPVNGSVTGGAGTTGQRTLTVANAGASISWQSDNGGLFRKSNATGTDVIYGGPDWVTGQSYSVFMAYRRIATSSGRLLNTQSEASKDWLMGLYNGNPNTFLSQLLSELALQWGRSCVAFWLGYLEHHNQCGANMGCNQYPTHKLFVHRYQCWWRWI